MIRAALLVVTGTSTLVTFAGGIAIAVLRAVEGEPLPAVFPHLAGALLAASLMGVAYTAIERLGRREPKPEPEPAPQPPPAPAAAPETPAAPGLAEVFAQMKTHVDLEMWEIAYDKANYILRTWPGSREAQIVSKNINELRWKAEPKFVSRASAVSREEQKSLQEKGLAAMLKHVKTYVELEMWELARQKALAILKHFPDSREATEVAPIFQQIEQRLKQVPAAKE